MSLKPFDYSLDFETTDFRRRPELYRIGEGEKGVLLVEPYKHGDRSSIVLLRTGEQRQGVAGLYQPNLPHERGRGLSVRFMHINRKAIASYLLSLYCSTVVLTEDALAVLEDVQLDCY
jgi:hypothetical protein